jgi:hypothetical protein
MSENSPNQNDGLKIIALLVASIGSFFTPFMGTSVNIALPNIAATFGADAITLKWVMNGFIRYSDLFYSFHHNFSGGNLCFLEAGKWPELSGRKGLNFQLIIDKIYS